MSEGLQKAKQELQAELLEKSQQSERRNYTLIQFLHSAIENYPNSHFQFECLRMMKMDMPTIVPPITIERIEEVLSSHK